MAITSLFGTVGTLGLDSTAVRRLVINPEQKEIILGSVLTLRAAGSIVAIVGSVIAAVVISPENHQLRILVLIISTGFTLQCVDSVDLWFQAKLQSRYSAAVRVTALLIFSAVKIYLVLSNAPLIAFCLAAAGESMLASAGFYIAFKLSGNSWLALRPKIQTMYQLISESWPLLLSGIAIVVYMRIDQIMLAKISGPHEVGIYSAALRLSEAWYVIPTVIVSSIAPSLFESKGISEDVYYAKISRLLHILVRVAVAIAIPITLISNSLIGLIYGPEYAGAGVILSIHIWSAVFVFMGVGTGPWIVSEKLQRFALFQTAFGAATNIGLNLILIPYYGAIGAAIATLVSQIVATYIALSLWNRTRRLFFIECSALLYFWRAFR